jgi:hypothetical protein
MSEVKLVILKYVKIHLFHAVSSNTEDSEKIQRVRVILFYQNHSNLQKCFEQKVLYICGSNKSCLHKPHHHHSSITCSHEKTRLRHQTFLLNHPGLNHLKMTNQTNQTFKRRQYPNPRFESQINN